MILRGGGAPANSSPARFLGGFTLAEVLITLGIIGIVAAITLPSVIGKYQKKVTVERLKKVYTSLSQALIYSVKDNDEIEYWDSKYYGNYTTERFVERYLSPYLNMNAVPLDPASKDPIYDRYHYTRYYLEDGTALSFNLTEALKIEVDLNGDKGPNKYGRDRFIYYLCFKKMDYFNYGAGTVLFNIPKAGLYPDGYGVKNRNGLLNEHNRGCNSNNDQSFNGAFCTGLIMFDGWEIKDDYNW